MKRLRFVALCLMLFITPLALGTVEQELEPQDLAYSHFSEFQWWVDKNTKLVNFRRCDFTPQRHCRPPMLLRGIAQRDVLTLLNYYVDERIHRNSNGLRRRNNDYDSVQRCDSADHQVNPYH